MIKLLNVNEKGLKSREKHSFSVTPKINNFLVSLISRKIIFAILAISLLLLTSCAQQEQRTVSVTGESEFDVDPDQVEITVSVQTNATEAIDAQKENADITKNVIDALIQSGIAKDEIETLNYNIYPITRWDPETGRSTQEGYQATNSIKVKTKDLEKAGDIIDAAVGAGADMIQNIQFSLSTEKEQAQNQIALQKAGENAKTKAANIAAGLGLTLGKITSVQESNVNIMPYPMRTFEAVAGDVAMEKAASTPIQPSKVTVRASISVTYSIG